MKYKVSHIENRSIAGHVVPVRICDGLFKTVREAMREAARLRSATCAPHFVDVVPDDGPFSGKDELKKAA